jgi:ubiquinone biosynthesis protein UbiJ
MAALPLAPLETLLNRSLASSTPGRSALKSLAGKSFAIHVTPPGGATLLALRFDASELGLALETSDAPADATVTGSPLGLAALLFGRADGRLTAAGVTISGDAEVAQAFEKLLRHAHPDAEAELARLIGDRGAYAIGRAARGLIDWSHKALNALSRSTGEYLTEESRDLVARAELDAFLTEVDRLREDVDRAAARLSRLTATRDQAQTAW